MSAPQLITSPAQVVLTQDAPTFTTAQANAITADYNTIKSSLVQFEEAQSITKWKTYSQIIITRYCYDDISQPQLKEMVTALVGLAEYVFDEPKSGD